MGGGPPGLRQGRLAGVVSAQQTGGGPCGAGPPSAQPLLPPGPATESPERSSLWLWLRPPPEGLGSTPARLRGGEDPGLGAASPTPPHPCPRSMLPRLASGEAQTNKEASRPRECCVVFRSGGQAGRDPRRGCAGLSTAPEFPGPRPEQVPDRPQRGGMGSPAPLYRNLAHGLQRVSAAVKHRDSVLEHSIIPPNSLSRRARAASPGPQVCFRLHRFAFCGHFL